MKKSLLILSTILVLFGCKKDKFGVTGTYKGTAHYYDLTNGDEWEEEAIVNVNFGEEENVLILTGDILNISGTYPSRFLVSYNPETDSIKQADGVFKGDSLIFSMPDHHWFKFGFYHLKKQ